MTLTTLGLSLRDETLVRSLLNVVGGNTRAEWRFVDEIDADLALCDPQSPFARMAMQKSQRTGRPRCVALLYGDASAAPLQHAIRAPMRVGELVKMLDVFSDPDIPPLAQSAVETPTGFVDGHASSNGRPLQTQWLVDVLQELMAVDDANRPNAIWRVEIGGFLLDILLPERRYAFLDHDITIDALVDIALSTPVDNVIRLDREDVETLGVGAATKPLDALLWRVGLRMVPNPSMPWLGKEVSLRLKRWPDFGRLGVHKAHLALAALLTKSRWRIDALVEASGGTQAELESFLVACGLCGLLEIEKVPPVALAPQVAKRRLGVSGLFRSLRSALRMGG